MFGKKRLEHELIQKARIKELENIICPGEIHDYQMVDEETRIVGCNGRPIYTRRYVCKRCLKAIEKVEYC